MPSYSEIVTSSIKNFVEHDKTTTLSDIMLQVMETLLEAERNTFLCEKESFETNKGNGHYQRFVKSLSGKILLRIPRDRLGHFKPALLEVMKNDEERLAHLACRLYTKGMSQRDISDVIQDIYETELSASWISRMSKDVEVVRTDWHTRPLSEKYFAIFIDALFVPIRRDCVSKEAFYVALGLKADGTREILGLYTLPGESSEGWSMVISDLKKRGIKDVSLFIADGLSGLPDEIQNVFPATRFQSCVVHKMRNILLKVRPTHKKEVASGLKEIFNLDLTDDDPERASIRLRVFIDKWSTIYPHLERQFPEDLISHLFTYLTFPPTIRRMIYTTNWIERLNKHIRKVIKNKNSFPSEDSAMNLIFLAVTDFEQRVYKFPIYKIASLQEI